MARAAARGGRGGPCRPPADRRLVRFFHGEEVAFDDVPLDWEEETEFGRALGEALVAVPRGEVVTYGELAALGGPARGCAGGRDLLRAQPLAGLRALPPRCLGWRPRRLRSLGGDYKRRLLALEGVTVR